MVPQSILFLSLYYEPEITGNAAVLTSLAQMLASRGHAVHVIAGTPHYRLPEVPRKYRRRLFVEEELSGVHVTRCFAYPNTIGIAAKLLNYLSFLCTSLIAALKGPRTDVIVSVTPPFLLGTVAWLVARLRGARFIYNAQDLFPESYVCSGVVRHRGVIRVMDAVQRWIYARADAIAVVCESFRSNLLGKGIDGHKVVCIPNFTNQESIRPGPRQNVFSHQYALDDKFVVMFAGNIGFTHGAEIIASVAKRFEALPLVQFVVVGEGSGLPALLSAARGATNIRFLPPQPSSVLSEMLASCDIGLVTTKPGVAKASFPSRIYGLMAAGRPIVAGIDLDSDAADLLTSAGCGLVVPPADEKALYDAIWSLANDSECRRGQGLAGRQYLEQHYSNHAIVSRYEMLFSAVQIAETKSLTSVERD